MNREPMIFEDSSIKFIEILSPLLIGDRFMRTGDVVEVQPYGKKPRTIMPVDPHLYYDRASQLIKEKYARPHKGPATANLGNSLDHEKHIREAVERATAPAPKQATRAVGTPQKQGAF